MATGLLDPLNPVDPTATTNPAATTVAPTAANTTTAAPTVTTGGYTPPEFDSQALLDASVTDINTLTSQNNPLMQQASTQGLQQANERGLLNSSMAVGAAQNARLNTVMPLVGQNAATRGQAALADRQNIYSDYSQSKAQDWQSGEMGLDRAQQTALQESAQGWQSGESALDRAHQLGLSEQEYLQQLGLSKEEYQQRLGLAEQANTFLTARDQVLQAFEAEQSALGREQQTTMQAADIAAALGLSEQEYLQQMALAEQSQAWQSSEAALGRAQELTVQDKAIASQMGLSDQEYQQQRQLADQANTFTAERDQIIQDFEASQSALDREQGITMQANEIAAAMGLSEQEYQQRSALADQANAFTAEQSALARAQEIDMLNLDTESRSSLISLEQQWNAYMTNNQALSDVWQSNIKAMGDMLAAGLTTDQTEAALDYYMGPADPTTGVRTGGIIEASLGFVASLNGDMTTNELGILTPPTGTPTTTPITTPTTTTTTAPGVQTQLPSATDPEAYIRDVIYEGREVTYQQTIDRYVNAYNATRQPNEDFTGWQTFAEWYEGGGWADYLQDVANQRYIDANTWVGG
jgi:DNA-directed RNA polymerase specialized sigma subunit